MTMKTKLRQGYASRHLMELEDAVMQRFHLRNNKNKHSSSESPKGITSVSEKQTAAAYHDEMSTATSQAKKKTKEITSISKKQTETACPDENPVAQPQAKKQPKEAIFIAEKQSPAANQGEETASTPQTKKKGKEITSITEKESVTTANEAEKAAGKSQAKNKAKEAISVSEKKTATARPAEKAIFKPKAKKQAISKGGNEPKKPTFTPFPLLYNECSITSIGSWVGKDYKFDRAKAQQEKRKKCLDTYVFDQPAPGPVFRKCSICSLWGHYEVECQAIQPRHILDLAKQVKIQSNIYQLLEKNRNPQEAPFRFARFEHREDGDTFDEDLSDHHTDDRYLSCDVCHNGFGDEEMIVCEGCERLSHLRCLDPPMFRIPKGDWYCAKCDGHNSGHSSDVEVEGCEGFVIEQRKRPREDDNGHDNPEERAHKKMAVGAHAANITTEAADQVLVEETEIDGFCIKAGAAKDQLYEDITDSTPIRSYFKNSDICRAFAAAYHESMPVVPGCIVAWFDTKKTTMSSLKATPTPGSSKPQIPEEEDQDAAQNIKLGVVLTIDPRANKALTRVISDWKEAICQNDKSTISDNYVHISVVGATIWIPCEQLHAVGTGKILPRLITSRQESQDDQTSSDVEL